MIAWDHLREKYHHEDVILSDFCDQKEIVLLSHQKLAIDYFTHFSPHRGLLCYHSTGSGKTVIAVKMARIFLDEKKVNSLLFLGRKILHENFIREAKKASVSLPEVELLDYESGQDIGSFNNKFVIMDESHIFMSLLIRGDPICRNIYEALMKATCKIVMLSATPILDTPFELAPMFNLLSGKELFSRQGIDFYHMYINDKVFAPMHQRKIRKLIDGLISFFIFDYGNRDLFAQNSFGKIHSYNVENPQHALVDLVQGHKTLIYTEYPERIDDIYRMLPMFKCAKFSQKTMDRFNHIDNVYGEKIQVMIGSQNMAMGVSFRAVSRLIFYEIPGNYSKAIQVAGRVLRLCSHNDLPKAKRKIDMYGLIITDQDLKNHTLLKLYSQMIAQFWMMFKVASIEQRIFKRSNVYFYLFNFLRAEM